MRMILCWILVLGAGPLGADQRLTLKVSPAVAFAPANLIVRTMVEADARNRAIAIVAESVGSSRVDLQACKLEYSIVSPK